MPLWLGVLCIILGVSGILAAAVGAVNNYKVALPIVGDIQFTDSTLSIEEWWLVYNSTNLRYTYMNLTIANTGAPCTAKFEIRIYTSTGILIAEGANSVTIGTSNGVPLDTEFTWYGNYTALNCSIANFQLHQTG